MAHALLFEPIEVFMGSLNFTSCIRLVVFSLVAMVSLAACGPSFKQKELKAQAEVLVAAPGGTPAGSTPAGQATFQGLINYDVTFESLKMSSINGFTSDGTIKLTLTDKRTGASRSLSESVRANPEQITSDYIQNQTDEPRMSWSAKCASLNCGVVHVAVLFVFQKDGQSVASTALGIVQDGNPDNFKKAYMDFGSDVTTFEDIIRTTELVYSP